MIRFIEPNKPIRTNEEFLDEIDNSYIVDTKLDGWRIEIRKINGEIHSVSRTNKNYDLPHILKDQFYDKLPEGMGIDAEWINKSRLKAINTIHGTKIPLVDCIVLFDIRWMNGKYISAKTLDERREIDFYKNLPIVDINNIENGLVCKVCSSSGNKSKQFYKKQKSSILSEGLVIKKKSGNLDSPWYKVKYRE